MVAKAPPKYHSKGSLTLAEDASYASKQVLCQGR